MTSCVVYARTYVALWFLQTRDHNKHVKQYGCVPKTPVDNLKHVFTIPYTWDTFHASGTHHKQQLSQLQCHGFLDVGSEDSGWH